MVKTVFSAACPRAALLVLVALLSRLFGAPIVPPALGSESCTVVQPFNVTHLELDTFDVLGGVQPLYASQRYISFNGSISASSSSGKLVALVLPPYAVLETSAPSADYFGGTNAATVGAADVAVSVGISFELNSYPTPGSVLNSTVTLVALQSINPGSRQLAYWSLQYESTGILSFVYSTNMEIGATVFAQSTAPLSLLNRRSAIHFSFTDTNITSPTAILRVNGIQVPLQLFGEVDFDSVGAHRPIVSRLEIGHRPVRGPSGTSLRPVQLRCLTNEYSSVRFRLERFISCASLMSESYLQCFVPSSLSASSTGSSRESDCAAIRLPASRSYSASPTISKSRTPTLTRSTSSSPSPSPVSPTASVSRTRSASRTFASSSATRTSSRTPNPTGSDSPSPTAASRSPSRSRTASVTPSESDSPTFTTSSTRSISLSSSPSQTMSPSETPSNSISQSQSITPTTLTTSSMTGTPTSSVTASRTASITPSITPSITSSRTASITPSITASFTPSVSVSHSATSSPSPSGSTSFTPTSTATGSSSVTESPTVSPSKTPSPTTSRSVSASPTKSRSHSASPSVRPSPSQTRTSSRTTSPTPSMSATPSITPTSSTTPSTTPTPSATESVGGRCITDAPPGVVNRDYWFDQLGDLHCYYDLGVTATYEEAQATCQLHNTYLSTIVWSPENGIVQSLLGGRIGFIGMRFVSAAPVRRLVVDRFGETPLFENWAGTEPNGNGECGGMSSTGEWYDTSCSRQFNFICERDYATSLGLPTATGTSCSDHSIYSGVTASSLSTINDIVVCLAVLTADIDFEASRLRCAAVRGGHLASIDFAQEQTVIDSLPLPSGSNAYIGLKFDNVNSYYWDASMSMDASHRNWDTAAGEPSTTDRCVSVDPVTGLWASTSCGEALPFVCEVPMSRGLVPLSACSTRTGTAWNADFAAYASWVDNDAYLHCYGLKTAPDSWDNSVFDCQRYFASAASLASEAEADIVNGLAEANGLTAYWTAYYFYDPGNLHGGWFTLPIEEVGYTRWRTGYPMGLDFCVAAYNHHSAWDWEDTPCPTSLPHICEIIIAL